jgi:copper transport protein
LLAGALLGWLPAGVAAHAELLSSAPEANASLETAPDAVELDFTEPIDAATAFVDLLDPSQREVEGVGPVEVTDDGLAARVSLPTLERGVYTVSYQVISTVDGHATTGRYAFLVDPTGAAAPPASPPAASSPSVDALTVGARLVGLLGFLLGFGSLVAWWRAGGTRAVGRPPWTLVGAAAAAGAIGLAAYLWLAARPIAALGDEASGFPLDVAAPFGWSPFAIAMRISILAGIAGVALAILRRRASDRWSVAAAAIILAAGLAGMSAAGHAASYGGPAFAALDWAHLVAVAAWLGAIPALLLMARGATPETGSYRAAAGRLLRRHGGLAMVAAPVVALTGIANSPLVLGASRDLVATGYGNLLLAKAGLLCIALGIGAVNHLALRGRGRASALALVGAELVLAAVAVGAAATMVTVQPASAQQPMLAAAPLNPAHFFGEAGPSRVHATINPPAPGRQTIQVSVTERDGGLPAEDVQKVFAELTPPADAGLPAGRLELAPGTVPGLFTLTGANTPVVGEWSVELIVRRAGELDESIAFELPVVRHPTPESRPPSDTGIGVPAPVTAIWSLLPGGWAAWGPSALAMVALLAFWRKASVGRLPRSVARGALVAIIVVGGIGAASRTIVDAANRPVGTVPAPTGGDPAAGEGLYRANCAACHGRDGAGDGPTATLPRLRPLVELVPSTSDADLSYRIANGVAGTPMPPFAGQLTPEERADVVAYLRARWGER